LKEPDWISIPSDELINGQAINRGGAAGQPRGSAGGEGPRGFFSRAGGDAALLPPAVFPLWRVRV
jgi:hypothetical protein